MDIASSLVIGLRKIPELSHLSDICIMASLSLSLSQLRKCPVASLFWQLAWSEERFAISEPDAGAVTGMLKSTLRSQPPFVEVLS